MQKRLRLFPGLAGSTLVDTVDGRNPANQLRLVVFPLLTKVLAPSLVVLKISSINSMFLESKMAIQTFGTDYRESSTSWHPEVVVFS